MSSDPSLSSYEVVDVSVQNNAERQGSYYPSQLPEENTDRIQTPPQDAFSPNTVHVDAPKVEELAENLLVATRENEKYRIAMQQCNVVLSKQVEVTEARSQEIESMRAQVEKYRVRNEELENHLSAMPASERSQHQDFSQSADDTEYSAADATADLRGQLEERNAEAKELRMMNIQLQQSQESLQFQYDQLNQTYQKLIGDSVDKSEYSRLQEEFERMNLSDVQSTGRLSELQEENDRLKRSVQSRDKEIAKLQQESLQQSKSEFQTLPTNTAQRVGQSGKLMRRLESLSAENSKLKDELRSLQDVTEPLKEDKEKLEREIMNLKDLLSEEKKEKEEKVRHYSDSASDLTHQRNRFETLYSQVSEDHMTTTEQLNMTKVDLQEKQDELCRKEQELQEMKQESAQLKEKIVSLEMENQQTNAQLSAASKNLDSLQRHKQEVEAASGRATEAELQLQQENTALVQKLQDGNIERDKLLEQLREAYGEKEKVRKQFDEYMAACNEKVTILEQNNEVLQKRESEYKSERETMIGHIQNLDGNGSALKQQLNETLTDYQNTLHELESSAQRRMAFEGELKNLRGHYNQVNDERNQLKRALDEKSREKDDLEKEKDRMFKENSDTMELMRNQLQQYARDYEEERVGREKFAQQMIKLQKSLKEKDEEIDSLQEQLSKFSFNLLKPVDLKTSAGGNTAFGPGYKAPDRLREHPMERSGGQQWSGNKGPADSYGTQTSTTSSQGSDDRFTSSYPPVPAPAAANPRPSPTARTNAGGGHQFTNNTLPRQLPATNTSGPYDNTPFHTTIGSGGAGGGGGVGMNNSLPPPDFNTNRGHLTEIQPPRYQVPVHEPYNNPTTVQDIREDVQPCPLCGKRFLTIEELSQHAALCC